MFSPLVIHLLMQQLPTGFAANNSSAGPEVRPLGPVHPATRTNRTVLIQDLHREARNWVIPTLCLALAVVYVPLAICGFLRDRSDDTRMRLSVISDKAQPQRSAYLITIITGWHYNSGTTSKVAIKLYGTIGDSEKIWLSNTRVPHFTTAAEDTFILMFRHKLGTLTKLELYHDNTGSSPNWYVSLVAVKNLLTLDSWLFLFDRRLDNAIGPFEEGNLAIGHETPHEDVMVIRRPYQLGYYVRRLFRSSHLWFSIFFRPYGDTFTRPQRITCVFSALVHLMSFNIIYRESTVETSERTYINLGVATINYSNVLVVIKSGLTCFILDFFIDQLFRRSAPLHHTLPTYVKSRLKQLTQRAAEQCNKRPGPRPSQDCVGSVATTLSSKTNLSPSVASLESVKKNISEVFTSRLLDFYSTHTDLDPVFNPKMVSASSSRIFALTEERGSRYALGRATPSRSVIKLPSKSSCHACGASKVTSAATQGNADKKLSSNNSPHTSEESMATSGTTLGNGDNELDLSEGSQNSTKKQSSIEIQTNKDQRKSSSDITLSDYQDTCNDWKESNDRLNISNNAAETSDGPKPLLTKPRAYVSYWFPSCCVYMAWMIPICSCAVCTYIMIAYSHSYDEDKSLQWIFSTLISVLQSATLIQPAKVIITGLIDVLLLQEPITSAHCLFFYRHLD